MLCAHEVTQLTTHSVTSKLPRPVSFCWSAAQLDESICMQQLQAAKQHAINKTASPTLRVSVTTPPHLIPASHVSSALPWWGQLSCAVLTQNGKRCAHPSHKAVKAGSSSLFSFQGKVSALITCNTVPVITVPCPLMGKQWSMANRNGCCGGCSCCFCCCCCCCCC